MAWKTSYLQDGEAIQIRQIYESIEDGRYSLEAVLIDTGDGIMLYLGGGDKPHVGTAVISQPRPSMKNDNTVSCTTSIINRLSHKDDFIVIPMAEAVCKAANTIVVASGGVHVDNADEADIKRIIDNMEKLKNKILEKLIVTEAFKPM